MKLLSFYKLLIPPLGVRGLKFLLKSKNEHSVHSPFVFNFLTKCCYDKNFYHEYETLEKYRLSLLNNNTFIEVTDFGAGSRVFKSNKRRIAQIAKTAGISENRAKLLFRLVRYFKPQTILEIGTSLGLATSALALGNPKATITSLEGCPATLSVTESLFQDSRFKFPLDHIEFVNTEFFTYLRQVPPSGVRGFVYFDGNHSQHATLDNFNLLLPTVSNDSIWIFDDIHWSLEMENAWEIIKSHPKVKVTIDTFQWGIVFFRAEQEKEHFVIRV
jgi:predicted O-methyltransferase YrrM